MSQALFSNRGKTSYVPELFTLVSWSVLWNVVIFVKCLWLPDCSGYEYPEVLFVLNLAV